jgi:hypothetical protein
MTATATCPSGQIAVGGGGTISGSWTGLVEVVISQSFAAGNGWTVIYQVVGPGGADTGTSTATVTAHVMCVS